MKDIIARKRFSKRLRQNDLVKYRENGSIAKGYFIALSKDEKFVVISTGIARRYIALMKLVLPAAPAPKKTPKGAVKKAVKLPAAIKGLLGIGPPKKRHKSPFKVGF